MTGSRNSPNQHKRGSIIVLVLVFVVLLTFIVVAFLEEATAKIKYYGLFHNRDDLRTDAYSAMEITLAVLNQYIEVEGALWGPEQGWADPLDEAGFVPAHANSVTVTFEDESAKLPLSKLTYDDLITLFDVMGYDLPEAQSLADGILDWSDEDDLRRLNGFDGEDYDDMDPPYRPSNSEIVSWDEFRLIHPLNETFWEEDGRPTPAWGLFKSAVSLYHTGTINVNQANATVLEYLYEKGVLDTTSFAYFKDGSDGIPGTEDDRLYRKGQGNDGMVLAEGSEVSDTIQLLRVKVDANRGEARFSIEALVTWSGSNPSAGDASDNRNRESVGTAVQESQPDSARDRRNQARGKTKTAPDTVAKLGYPFRFVRLSENRKI
jgi:general secretion pathway protein K